MRIIETDLATGNTTATTSDANFPITNLSDYNPKNIWKATTTTADITVVVANVQDYENGLFNTNMYTGMTWSLYAGISLQATGSMEEDGNGNFWIGPNTSVGICTHIVFHLSTFPNNCSAGILRTGYSSIYHDPMSLQQSYVDYSIKDRTRNQAIIRKQKDRIWIYEGQVLSQIDANGSTLNGDIELVRVAKELAPYPAAIKLLEKNYSRFVFGEITASGTITFDSIDYNTNTASDEFVGTCRFSIEEVI